MPFLMRLSSPSRSAPARGVISLVCLVALLPGCMFRRLESNLRQRAEYAVLRGNVSLDHAGRDPIFVVVYTSEGGGERVADSFALVRPGGYFFMLPAGTYQVAAFEDVGGDLAYRPGVDPAALLWNGSPVTAHQGDTLDGLDIELRSEARAPIPFAFTLGAARGIKELPDFHLGEITDPADSRFSQENAELGLWQPVDFLFDVGAGIYFLEPYDPQKIPVLFIHGAVGHPGIWKDLIARLDRERFQPWLFYYPSGASLETVAAALDKWTQYLWVTHRFSRFAVVAHSMGGLVARAFINRAVAAAGGEAPQGLYRFVSISTPWAGHVAAGRGVERAPVVVPSWYDMAPGSPFLQSVLAPPLPASVSYDLLFSYGGESILIDGANDGTVTLSSQLVPLAQEQAEKVKGFDEGHAAILRSESVAATVRELLGKE